jgi:Hemerythrin HHE cation binding domain
MPPRDTRADLIGFTLTHKLFRNEMPRLAAAFDAARHSGSISEVAEDHLGLVTDHLLRHHQEEDEFHWPVLAARAPGAVALLDRLGAQHTQMDPLVDGVRDRTRAPGQRAADLRRLTELVMTHLDEEDRAVVPLLQEHITGPEQCVSMQRSRAKIPASDQLRVLALLLDPASDDERTRMLAPLPPEVVDAWRTLGAPGLMAVHEALASEGATSRRTQHTNP